ncbi:Tyrosine-protein kinase abl1 [Desmophyllum pertusum]|uniref:Tyrosine-protein kinase abl1 n=1 Tax=Desmophyllum pertusum TaxID=174260 RepID=A0A9W9ZB93_9CNID|nr:Tyrosine-protein kinase abl1 [Desmophyllum pertusum]
MSCYQCSSNASLADCIEKQKVVNCTSPRDYCFKQKNTTTGDKNQQVAVYYKGCTSADKCRQKEKHSIECCSYQLCNKDLSCYQCTSNISFADCARNQTRVNCTSPMTRCAKTAYTTKGEDKLAAYYKGCATTDECTETAEKSFVECCSDDMCNKGARFLTRNVKKHRQEVTCKSSNADRCYYASMQQTSQDGSSVTKRFEHGCTNNKYCNNTAKLFDECITSSGACKVRCCSDKLCNKVNNGEIPTEENAVSNIKIAYILFGAAFLLLLLCFVVVFWCYKKAHRKRIERSARSRREIIPLDKWELLPDQIEYKEELGRGAFGVVYKATLKRRQGIEVFGTRKGLEPKKADQESGDLEDKNQSSIDPASIMVGSSSHDDGGVTMSSVAESYLAEKDFVHRDLAARNILVGRDNRVKVSDFGLMRQIYEDVYSAKKTKKLPVKWMAPESIHYSVFTIKSDV